MGFPLTSPKNKYGGGLLSFVGSSDNDDDGRDDEAPSQAPTETSPLLPNATTITPHLSDGDEPRSSRMISGAGLYNDEENNSLLSSLASSSSDEYLHPRKQNHSSRRSVRSSIISSSSSSMRLGRVSALAFAVLCYVMLFRLCYHGRRSFPRSELLAQLFPGSIFGDDVEQPQEKEEAWVGDSSTSDAAATIITTSASSSSVGHNEHPVSTSSLLLGRAEDEDNNNEDHLFMIWDAWRRSGGGDGSSGDEGEAASTALDDDDDNEGIMIKSMAHDVWVRHTEYLENGELLLQDYHYHQRGMLNDSDGSEGDGIQQNVSGYSLRDEVGNRTSNVEEGAKEYWKRMGDQVGNWTSRVEAGAKTKGEEFDKYSHEESLKWKHRAAIWRNRSQVWWNQTLIHEKLWYEHTMSNLHHFGAVIKSWFHRERNSNPDLEGSSRGNVSDDVDVNNDDVESRFKQWWEHASETERQWWNATVDAFDKFGNKTEIWWNMTKHALTPGHWNLTKHKKRKHRRHKNATAEGEGGDDIVNGTAATDDNNGTDNVLLEDVEGWWEATKDFFHRLIHRNKDNDDLTNGTAEAAATITDDSAFYSPLVYFNTSHSYNLLMSDYGWFYDQSSDFFHYQLGWDVQKNQGYCSVASSAALLNSLKAELDPNSILTIDPVYSPYHYATQDSLMTTNSHCVNKNVVTYNETYDGIRHFPGGLSLEQTGNLLKCYLHESPNITTTVVYGDNVTISGMRRHLQLAVSNPNARTLVNFDRAALGQHGGGHFSPIAAYSPVIDSFLLMDVAKYKYPPVWVPTHRLYKSILKKDKCATWDHRHVHNIAAQLLNVTATTPEEEMRRLAHKINCRSGSRGYIIVEVKHP